MLIPPLLSFLLIIILILALSKYELSIILFLSSFLFALLTAVNIFESTLSVVLNPSIVILAIAVTFIPILGGIMEDSGLMLELVQKMRVSKKASLMVSPAFFGLLPVAGGALMSAPIVDQIDRELNPNQKVAINVWYRHVLIFIYPLSSALIVASILSNISLYVLVVALAFPCLILILIGYLTMVKNVEPFKTEQQRDLKRVFHNLIPIIIAPIIDFIGRTFFGVIVPETFLLIGLVISVLVALVFAQMSLKDLKPIVKKMKIWRFPLLILAMFLFLEVFIRSGVPEEIGAMNLPLIMFIILGFVLGFATGRIQIPLSILIPIYLIQFNLGSVFLLDFILIYSAIFVGYLITPVHPCVAYSTQYFDSNYKNVLRFLAVPASICFGLVIGTTLIYSLF